MTVNLTAPPSFTAGLSVVLCEPMVRTSGHVSMNSSAVVGAFPDSGRDQRRRNCYYPDFTTVLATSKRHGEPVLRLV